MDDTISRQAAIDAVYTASGTGTALKALKHLPSAQPERRWIPVMERLPDKECFVLVTVNDGSIYTDLSLFRHDGRFIEHTGDVIAWMALPEPYKGGRENE